MLDYRVGLIRRHCEGREGGVLLEIGCGTAIHLAVLADMFSLAIGTDISPSMIAAAEDHVRISPHRERVALRVDSAEVLGTVPDNSVDVAICVGAIEHMLNQGTVIRQVARVLTRTGIFIVLTPNGGYWWYKFMAPCLGIPTRHLSTDHFLTRQDFAKMAVSAGLRDRSHDYWTFIPKGDMPRWAAATLQCLDRLGRSSGIGGLRGGLILTASKDA